MGRAPMEGRADRPDGTGQARPHDCRRRIHQHRGVPTRALWLTVACVALPTLFYQNTGWVQFGYRFSNDYAVFLFALLAVIGIRYGKLFTAASIWSVAASTATTWN